jgi:hypothetical protein
MKQMDVELEVAMLHFSPVANVYRKYRIILDRFVGASCFDGRDEMG